MMRMMRAQYESLAVHDLKEIAKARGLRGVSGMKKAELIDAMIAMDTADEKEGAEKESKRKKNEKKENEKGENGKKEREEHISEGQPVKDEGALRSRKERASAESFGQEEKAAARQQKESRAEQPARSRERTARPERAARSDGQSGRMGVPREQKAGQRNEKAQNGFAAADVGGSEHHFGEETPAAAEREYGETVAESRMAYQTSGAGEDADGLAGEADGNQRESGFRRSGQRTQPGQNRAAGGKAIMSRSQEPRYYSPYNRGTAPSANEEEDRFPTELDSGITVSGILEVMPDGYGFIRSNNYLPGENDVYVAPSQIRRFNLKTGDILEGNTRIRTQNEKFSALLYVKTINGYTPEVASRRSNFEDMTPIFPDSRLKLEKYGSSVAMRIVDLLSPIGKGQRGMIVSPPKAGKTTLLKEIAISVKKNYPDMHLIILLIDERPEEVTDIRETVEGPNVEVVYSTFDELPDHHKRVSEMVVERARRLVEHKRDVMILLDSITRLTRAYNLVVPPSGRTLSGGIDPAALHMPKRFFGAARNMREGGSLTILATALVDTGSRMDDVIYEEFKGTGNMELVLDRKLSEKRLFPAIDIAKTSTRREDLLLSAEEMEAINIVRRALNGMKADEAADKILDLFAKTRTNTEFVQTVKKMRFIG